ncbi:type II TA system antitoxin MqsA family protein [Haploplasma axanthum]|uniref:Putative zinc finger/helix-turn-helix protein, YgiT family n=1 Tax=Haploplasma axanthum TaxID=29552 RepID=A0A449BFW7_HAPAX|nr:type II TA system antitoxin MqsA family protein [Haploplasma axanthum]VEU81329.1 putative zinc finger/helix-turn-helix protein, YgiT family [Haploplasma axanthum]
MKMYCAQCDKDVEVIKKKEKKTYEVKDEIIDVTITRIYCAECNELIYDKKNEVNNDIIVYDEYRKIKGLLTSEEIRKIRSKYNISQKEMSQLLGFGEKTVTRYENGYIQDKSNDILMRLVDDKESFEQILKLSNNGKLVAKIKKLVFQNQNAVFTYSPTNKVTFKTAFEIGKGNEDICQVC